MLLVKHYGNQSDFARYVTSLVVGIYERFVLT